MKFQATIREVMKKDVKCISPLASIKKAAQLMKRYKIGSLVVKKGKKVVGIVTSSDIVYKYVASKKRKRRVKEIMSTHLIKISPNKTIEDAARLMVEKNIEKILVFEKGKLIGIITANDILKVEPALIEVLLERMKISGKSYEEAEPEFGECENCGNYSDDLEEVNGVWLCEECREEL